MKTLIINSLFVLSLIFVSSGSTLASVIYVKQDATGFNNGQTWDNAYNDLQSALDEARSLAPTSQEVWVAYGTYKPTVDIGGGTSSGDKNLVFFIDFDIELYGGFCGWETSINQRTKYLCPSILSGDHEGNDVLITNMNDPNFPADSVADNSYNVMRLKCLSATSTIDGFTIRGGRAFHSNTFSKQTGGGAYIDGSSCAVFHTISNCIFEHNAASRSGGGMFQYFNTSSFYNPKILNNIFRYNYGQLVGGAIGSQALAGTSSPLIQNCLFTANLTGFAGGAIAISAIGTGVISDKIENCTFHSNSSLDQGGALSAASETSVPDQVIILNSIFNSNFATNGLSTNNFLTENTNVVFSHCLYPESDGSNGNSNAIPVFENSVQKDFRLKKESPGINEGSNLVFNQYDLNGNDRVIDTIDIGAYEYLRCPENSTIYVNSDNLSNSGDGSSWDRAIGELQMAFEMACDCAEQPIIKIAKESRYVPSRNFNFQPDAINNEFFLKCDAHIIGGYNTVNDSIEYFARPLITGDRYNGGRGDTIHIRELLSLIPDDPDLFTTIENVELSESSIRGLIFRPSNVQGLIVENTVFRGHRNTAFQFEVPLISARAPLSLDKCQFHQNGMDPFQNHVVSLSSSVSKSIITDCIFDNNSITALDIASSECSEHHITRCVFSNNTANTTAGIDLNFSNNLNHIFRLSNSLFTNNSSSSGVSAVNARLTPTVDAKIDNCTFLNNATNSFAAGAVGASMDGNVNITNSIFWQNTDSQEERSVSRFANASIFLDHSLIGESSCPSPTFITCGTNMLYAIDPMLDYGSFLSTYGPIEDSPVIDIGLDSIITTTKDLNGDARVLNNRVDLGAVEYQLPCIDDLILDPNVAPFTSDKLIGTWRASNSILLKPGFIITDEIYLSLDAPNVLIEGIFERNNMTSMEITIEGCE